MRFWLFYVIAVMVAVVLYLLNASTVGMIWAITALALLVALPFVLEKLINLYGLHSLLYGLVGLLFAIAVVALLKPLFSSWELWFVVSSLLLGSSMFLFSHWIMPIATPMVEVPIAEVKETDNSEEKIKPKILDTSIIIDGRIIDLSTTGFVEGALVVPNFVLREIQLISDSPDPLKRNRGRRGLDMLNQLQKRDDLEVRISYKDYNDTREVDAKLVRLAIELNGKLVTNDFNLNKVAELQGVQVLNINNLANALKPVVLPGEELDLQVVKEGKDENQGIGYLDDGTMVVIENGGKLMNKKIKVSVTSVIQTNAGKMIFTKVASKS